MKCPLAVIEPDPLGSPVATFIRRHTCDLLPGCTAVAAPLAGPADQVDWSVAGPVLDLRQVLGGRLRWQVAGSLARHAGIRLDHFALRRFWRRHEVEVVLGEYLDFSLQWLDTARALGVPFFAHAHGHDVSGRLRDPGRREQYLRYDGPGGVITMSRFSHQQLREIGLPAARIHVVPYGVDVPAEPLTRPERDQVRCLAVGRAVSQKAPILLLDSFRRAAERFPTLYLDMIGDGPLLPAAQEFVRAFHLDDRVRFHGAQSNHTVLEFMRRADLFLQHSITDPNTGDQEGLPVAILEAMAHTLPVVSTREAGIPEAVVEGETGCLVDPGDTEAMAHCILALAGDADRRACLGLAGWRRARDHFRWERERTEILGILGLERFQ